jgi:hypothetical protein
MQNNEQRRTLASQFLKTLAVSGGVSAALVAVALVLIFTIKPLRKTFGVSSSGKAKLAVENVTDAANASKHRVKFMNRDAPEGVTTHTPDYLGIKLIAAYLAEDVDQTTGENVGETVMIYLNPACNEDIGNCNIGGNYDNIVSDFFEFTATTETVNAQLNAQERDVPPGTYKYVRLEFCKLSEGASNFSFQASTMTEAHSFSRPSCTTTAECVPPIEIPEGGSIRVRLDYDLKDLVWEYPTKPGSDANCTDSSPSFCLQTVDMVPSAVSA